MDATQADGDTLNKQRLLVLRDVMTLLDVNWTFDHDAEPIHALFEWNSSKAARTFRCNATTNLSSLRFTVQACLQGEPNAERLRSLDELNAQWGIGRVYYDAEQQHFDISGGLFLGTGLPAPIILRALLAHLVDGTVQIQNMSVPKFAVTHAPERTYSLQNVFDVLIETGLRPQHRPERNRVGVRVALSPTQDFVFEFELDDNNCLRVGVLENNPVALVNDDSVIEHLQSVNRGLDFGTVYYDRANGRFVFLMVIPLAWFPIDSSMIRWIMQQSISVMTKLQLDMERFS